jgi:hypothetical protein
MPETLSSERNENYESLMRSDRVGGSSITQHSDTWFLVTVITCPTKPNILSPFVIQGPLIPYQMTEAQQSYFWHFERNMIQHDNPRLWLLVQPSPKVLSRYGFKRRSVGRDMKTPVSHVHHTYIFQPRFKDSWPRLQMEQQAAIREEKCSSIVRS